MTSAIIVAAGSGKRMGTNIPKQFIEVNGLSILAHTVKGFVQSKLFDEIIIVLSKEYLADGEQLLHSFSGENIKLCIGGKERFHSVQNAIEIIDANCNIVFVHDSVRPFFSQKLLNQILTDCQSKDSAIPAVQLKDSIRKIEEETKGKSISQDRQLFRAIQTPQAFNFKKIKEAYNTEYDSSYTDDASVFEKAGFSIHLSQGESTNIKITTPDDLEWAYVKLKS